MSATFVLDRTGTLARPSQSDGSQVKRESQPDPECRSGGEDYGIYYLQSYPYGFRELRPGGPLKVEIRLGEDTPVSVFAPFIEVGGTGDTPEKAISDMLSTAKDVRDDLRATKTSKLHPSAVDLLSRLERVLR